jgi:renalase
VTSSVLVLGAGLAGLIAARSLHGAGHPVIVVDKGRGPGGRLATRRLGGAVLDHGAQFFTVRTPALAAQVADWEARGLVKVWSRGFHDEADGHPRYMAQGGMSALAKDLAVGLDVRLGLEVQAVRPTAAGYALSFAGATAAPLEAKALVATPPVPQTLELASRGGVLVRPEIAEGVGGLCYHRVLALLVRLDVSPGLRGCGAVQQPEDPTFTFIADNQAKGISLEPALTFHAAPALSSRWWDRADDEVRRDLLERATPWLGGAAPVEVQLKRWRYAGPVQPWPERSLLLSEGTGPLVLAGDAFGGPRFEGAFCSGLAAADTVRGSLEV